MFISVGLALCLANLFVPAVSEGTTGAPSQERPLSRFHRSGSQECHNATDRARLEASLQKDGLGHRNLTGGRLLEAKHAADAAKIQEVLLAAISNVSHVEQQHARTLGEIVGEVAVQANSHFTSKKNDNNTSVLDALKNRQQELENLIVPLGTALARLLIQRKPTQPPPVVHQEMENGIKAIIEQQQLQNDSARFAYMVANQIHLQEFAVCGHLMLGGLIQPYDYLEAVGSGVGDLLAIVNDDDKRATPEQVLRALEVNIASRIRVALILSGVAHNESLDNEIKILTNEIANYTANDVVGLMNRSEVLDKARQEMRMASAYYAKSLWNLRVLNLGSLVVLRTPPSLIAFTFEDDLASVLPATWLRFGYIDLEKSLELYNNRSAAI